MGLLSETKIEPGRRLLSLSCYSTVVDKLWANFTQILLSEACSRWDGANTLHVNSCKKTLHHVNKTLHSSLDEELMLLVK